MVAAWYHHKQCHCLPMHWTCWCLGTGSVGCTCLGFYMCFCMHERLVFWVLPTSFSWIALGLATLKVGVQSMSTRGVPLAGLGNHISWTQPTRSCMPTAHGCFCTVNQSYAFLIRTRSHPGTYRRNQLFSGSPIRDCPIT